MKTLHRMFGPKGNLTAANFLKMVARLQQQEGVRRRVVA